MTGVNLVLRPGNIFTKSLDFSEYGFGGGDPDERTGLLIVVLDEVMDIAGQIADVGERSAANGLLGNDPESPLHLIDP